jgi:hypothetical protein
MTFSSISRTPEEHRQHLEQALAVLREHQLYANLKKCSFAKPELLYLGHVVSKEGIKVDPVKIRAIQDWAVPESVPHLRSFLGLATYFRKFIRDFSRIAAPLHRLTRKDVPWDWSPQCASAFQALKDVLTQAPCLAFPDFTKPFEVHTDASLHGIGAVLYQDQRPIAYESRRLTPAEVNYPTGEQELLAVVHALTVWRCYLEGASTFRVVTDHKAITYLDTLAQLSRRQTRWAEFLSRFDFQWAHAPGKTHVVADALSRHPVDYQPPCFLLHGILLSGWAPLGSTPSPPPPPLAALRRAQTAPSRGSVSEGGEPWRDKFLKGYELDQWFQNKDNVEGLVPYDGFLLYEGRIAVPNALGLRAHLVQELHDSPYALHLGVNKTRKLVSRHYWWPTLARDVEQYVRICHHCQKNKAHSTKPSGLLQMIGTRQGLSTAYHPQTDGQTERVNRVLEDMLRMYVSRSQTDWDTKLACAEFAVNHSVQESTGSTPFFLNYGHHPYLPVSLLPNRRVPGATAFAQRMQRLIAEARQLHRIATQRQCQYANTKRRDVQFAEGDWVLLASKNLRFKQGTPKLLPRWVGPFQVVRKVGAQAYELNLPKRWKIHDVFHVSVLERYRSDGSVQPPPPAELLENEVEYEVERILSHRQTKGRGPNPYEYLVKWTGYSAEHNTWEPHANLKNAPEVLKSYWDSAEVRKSSKKRYPGTRKQREPTAPRRGLGNKQTHRA